ncbi:protein rnfH [Acidovorax sp. GW101-3H11]|uniref:RnfH family protein n=1 Tax=unclassified Acidovorax TaxID=2684926 RepID=UPI0007B50B59|nr:MULTISPECIES: RnfH family protein [unclassified Acidovorax]KZT16468.1 protein rnfH [Acidovorax sp. GW101-3H11]MBW8466381.1 RnfH family protein [Acidovorax sp.]
MAEGGAGKPGEGSTTVQVTVVVCVAPRETREWTLDLPQGALVTDALRACGAVPLPTPVQGEAAADAGPPLVGVWGRAVALDAPLQHGDRVEIYRPLKVDPKVARRERFARQGARSTGLFARQRPGGKSGY